MPANPFSLDLEGGMPRSMRRVPRGFRGDVSELTPERTEYRAVLRIAALLLVAALAAVGYRVFALTVPSGAHYRSVAEQNRLRREPLPALRGAVEDRYGTVLADNEPAYAVDLVSADLPSVPAERAATLDRIARALGTDRIALESALVAGAPRTTLRTGIPELEALQIGSALSEEPAVAVIARPVRRYRGPETAPVLGYVGRVSPSDVEAHPGIDPTGSIGRAGIESAYDGALRGTDGYRTVERDSANQSLRTIGTQPARPGDTLRLTLDAELQAVAHTELERAVRSTRAPGGALVALDPRTGEVLALATAPTFDPTALSRGLGSTELQQLLADPDHPFLNRAIAGEYPSGSTIKPVVAAQALDRGVITPATTVLSTGGLTVGGDSFPDWKPGGHGVTTVRTALADSVNTFFYYIGGGYGTFTGLGLSGLLDGFDRFGLGAPTGIDLPGERAGYLPTDAVRETRGAPWYLGDTYHLSIGQGPFAVTPLQIANATAVVANGGTLLRPYLVASATDPGARQRTVNDRTVRRADVVSTAAIRSVQQGMRLAVTDGSARALNDLPLPFAGKTGTAQFGDGSRTHAWFTAYGPTSDPRIVVTVLIEDGGEGHATALPVARALLRWWTEHRASVP